MYERMLDKQITPSFDDLINYSGESGTLWLELDKFFDEKFFAAKIIRFPYGNKYGWSVKYSQKSKHICDVFAENGAFTVLIRIANKEMDTIYEGLTDYSKSLWGNKYPCNDGGWLNFRVLNGEQLDDLKKIICAKMKVKL